MCDIINVSSKCMQQTKSKYAYLCYMHLITATGVTDEANVSDCCDINNSPNGMVQAWVGQKHVDVTFMGFSMSDFINY